MTGSGKGRSCGARRDQPAQRRRGFTVSYFASIQLLAASQAFWTIA